MPEKEKTATPTAGGEPKKDINFYKGYMEDYLRTNYGLKNPRNFLIHCLNPAGHLAGEDRHASMSYDYDRKKLHCFSCGADYSLIDLIQIEGHARNTSEALAYLRHIYEGAPLPETTRTASASGETTKELIDLSAELNADRKLETEEDKELKEKYLSSRGFTPKEVEILGGGFFSLYIQTEHASIKGEKITLKRLVIPYRTYKQGRGIITYNYNARLLEGGYRIATREDTLKAILSYNAETTNSNGKKQKVSKYKHHEPRGEHKFPKGFYNPTYLFCGLEYLEPREPTPIFITEGELDLLSILLTQESYLATLSEEEKAKFIKARGVALNGVGYNELLDYIKNRVAPEQRQNYKFILMLDNDTAGEHAIKSLSAELTALGFWNFAPNLLKDFVIKDINEGLSTDIGDFRPSLINLIKNYSSIEETERLAREEAEAKAQEEAKAEEIKAYNLKHQVSESLDLFSAKVKAGLSLTPITTGFNTLDNSFFRGIPKGLVCLGATTSLGKTTFILQIADQIAQQGYNDILYFSLEMSREELIAKSLSRLTFLEALKDAKENSLKVEGYKAENPNDLFSDMEEEEETKASKGKKEKNLVNFSLAYAPTDAEAYALKYSSTNIEIIQDTPLGGEEQRQKKALYIAKALNTYKTYAKKLYFYDSVATEGLSVKDIEEAIKEHIRLTGHEPIVFIDYLQIMKSPDTHLSDKQATDYNISALKRISAGLEVEGNKHNLLIFCVSSLNRASYGSKVESDSFKESGAVEYTNDILLGLNLTEAFKVEEYNNTQLESRGLGLTQSGINPTSLEKYLRKVLKARIFLDAEKKLGYNAREITIEVLKNRNGETRKKANFIYYPKANIYLERRYLDLIEENKSSFIGLITETEQPLKLLERASALNSVEDPDRGDLPF